MTAGSGRSDSNGTSRLPWEAIGICLTLIPLIPTVLRLIRVSELNPTILFTLVQTVDLIPLILASTLQTLPLLIIFATITFISIYNNALPAARRRYHRVIAWSIPFLLIATLMQSMMSLALFGLLYLINVVFLRRINKRVAGYRKLRQEQRRDAVNQVQTTAFLVCFLVFFSSEMWLPPHIITHDGRQDVGYVLQEGDRFTTVMLKEDRELLTIKSSELSMRQPCGEDRPFWARPLFAYYFNDYRARVPACPEPDKDPVPHPSTPTSPSASAVSPAPLEVAVSPSPTVSVIPSSQPSSGP